MSLTKEIGNNGEKLACAFLINNGFNILEKNWRFKKLEADIIALKNNTIHIIEVKTRSSTYFGQPEDFVSDKKLDNMMEIGIAYLEENGQYKQVQYDIVSITYKTGGSIEIFYSPDVYLME
jgi:putative endonuclease